MEKCAFVKPVGKDGGWGWIIVLSTFILKCIMDGVLYSHGIMYLEFLREFNRGKGETSWVGSVLQATNCVTTPIVSLLIIRYGNRIVTIVGSLVSTVGFITSMFVSSLYQLYFTYGILGGIGFSMMALSCCIVIIEYFDKRRSLAMGISVTGSGVGSIIFGPLSKWLIDQFGWRGTMLILAGITLNGVVCGAVFRPSKESQRHEESSTPADRTELCMFMPLGEDDQCQLETESINPSVLKLIESREVTDDTCHTDTLQANDLTHKSDTSVVHVEHPGDSEKDGCQLCKAGAARLWIFLTDVKFLLLSSCVFFYVLSYLVPYVFLPDMVLLRGYSRSRAAAILSIMGITNTVCRPVAGWIGDKKLIKHRRVLLFGLALLLSGILVALLPLCTTYTAFVVAGVFYSIVVATWVVWEVVVIADIFGDEAVNEVYGYIGIIATVPSLIGNPVCGWLYDGFGRYDIPFIVAGGEYLVAGILALFIPLHNNWSRYRNRSG